MWCPCVRACVRAFLGCARPICMQHRISTSRSSQNNRARTALDCAHIQRGRFSHLPTDTQMAIYRPICDHTLAYYSIATTDSSSRNSFSDRCLTSGAVFRSRGRRNVPDTTWTYWLASHTMHGSVAGNQH